MKQRTLEGFGTRLAAIRKSRGITQAELGAAVGVSNRVIAYYEQDQAQPPGPLLADLAQALRVSTDELLGLEPVREKTSPGVARLRKRLRQVEELPKVDQQAVLKFVDALAAKQRATASSSRRRSTARQRASDRA
jgi:transcriptional regulator with XRE-family HTH domain